MRRYFVIILVGCLGSLQGFAAEAKRPNILLILVDDVGYADINAFASHLRGTPIEQHFRETPRIDQLARDGMMFTQFYAHSVCTPTRASLLTGKMPNRLGMWDAFATTRKTFENTRKPVPEGAHIQDQDVWDEYGYSRTDRGVSVPLASTALHDVKTLPQGLKGYHSAFIGKWHLGSHGKPGYQPEDHGFNETLAYYDGGGSSYYRPFKAPGGWIKPGEKLEPQQDYLSDDIAQRVGVFLEKRATQHAGEPFFLYVAHPAAHTPIESRADDETYFKQKSKQGDWLDRVSPGYAGLLKGMDRSIGEMLDQLAALGLAENTAVIFLSDNGGLPKTTNSVPLRGGKSMQYEGGIRVPMIVRWPGHAAAGSSSNMPCDIADIYPTLMEIAGVDYEDFKKDPTTDGESLTPLLSDPANRAKQYGRSEFYQFYGKMGYKGHHHFATWATLRKGDYKLHYDYQGKVELYNIADDISESKNLTATQPELTQQMLVQLTGWLAENCKSVYLPQPNPDFDPEGPLPYGPYIPLGELEKSLGTKH
jgi:arylsulfatase A-like enzyme